MMTTLKITALALFGMALVSCVPPKAVVIGDNASAPNMKPTAPTAAPTQATAAADSNSPKPTPPAMKSTPGDDASQIRMPDMFGLPGEGDFRTTQPKKTESDSGAVIARPPKE